MEKSKVFFTDMHATSEANLLQKLERLMRRTGFEKIDFKNKFVAVKLHFGEPGNLAYLRANYAGVVCNYIKRLGGKPFVTDCNTLYVGGRKNGIDHLDSAYKNGYNPFSTGVHTIIADGIKGTEERLVPVENGEYVKEAKIGSAIMDADIIISLNHFKGHELTGFGGALKNLGMGCGSRAGKMEMHSAGKPHVDMNLCIGCGKCQKICAHDAPVITSGKASIAHNKCVGCGRCIGVCPKDAVLAAFDEANDVLNCKIAEYTKAVVQGRPSFHINLVIDVAPYCDCHAENDIAIVPDVGMFASFDPVALDMACADAVNRQPTVSGSVLEKHGHKHGDHFTDVSPETNWISALQHGQKIGLGTMEYELIEM
ncbi:MAG: putative Fe-S center protein [Firmicutes bacterium]|nr:putative Fe-S center protein [Bacillota bacterium]